MLLSLVSCDRQQTTEQTVNFETLRVDTVCPLFANYAKPACHIKVQVDVPTGEVDKNLGQTIERFIAMLPKDGAFEETADGTVASMVKAYVRDYILQYLSEGPDAIDNYGENMEAAATWMSYEEEVEGRVLYNRNNLLSYQFHIDSYTGGAHGNTKTYNGVLDLQRGQSLTLESMFDDVVMPQLNTMLRNRLAQQYECQTVDELAEKALFFEPNEIEATENFYVGDSAIIWIYDPYDIAPYNTGEVQVALAWNEVYALLKGESPVMRLAANPNR